MNSKLSKIYHQTKEEITNHPVLVRKGDNDFAIIIAYFNPCAYVTPILNLKKVLDNLIEMKIDVFLGEVVCGHSLNLSSLFGNRSNRVFSINSDTIWFHKEAIWNLVGRQVSKLYSNLVFLDADIIIIDRDRFVSEVTYGLEHFKVIQPYSKVCYLRPDGIRGQIRRSAGWAFSRNFLTAYSPKYWSCGFAIAVQNDFFNECGGFFQSYLGEGDVRLIAAILGNFDFVCQRFGTENEWKAFISWAYSVKAWCNSSLGVCSGEILHLFHGSLDKRNYDKRIQYMKGFDPISDVEVNSATGLPEWSVDARNKKSLMISTFTHHFFERDEDEELLKNI